MEGSFVLLRQIYVEHWSRRLLAITNTDFLSFSFSLLSLLFNHFEDTQEADILWALIF